MPRNRTKAQGLTTRLWVTSDKVRRDLEVRRATENLRLDALEWLCDPSSWETEAVDHRFQACPRYALRHCLRDSGSKRREEDNWMSGTKLLSPVKFCLVSTFCFPVFLLHATVSRASHAAAKEAEASVSILLYPQWAYPHEQGVGISQGIREDLALCLSLGSWLYCCVCRE